jgi:hypothetical protein
MDIFQRYAVQSHEISGHSRCPIKYYNINDGMRLAR